ncbi:MAG TPA: hypothetical protein RMF84_06200 [Polyangiaceae bacterium LLY-WYZ-14_1]|nr:hypothetical protein [Polyangiaceae bacterium LLY-WYZ-14_1]
MTGSTVPTERRMPAEAAAPLPGPPAGPGRRWALALLAGLWPTLAGGCVAQTEESSVRGPTGEDAFEPPTGGGRGAGDDLDSGGDDGDDDDAAIPPGAPDFGVSGMGLRASAASGFGDEDVDAGEARLGPSSCFDETDNDDDGRVDCQDPGCLGLRSCCVGSGSCCAILDPGESPLPADADFSACGDGAPDGCPGTADAEVFGAPGPEIAGGALRPGGGLLEEGGAALGTSVDLDGRRVRLEATFAAPGACGVPCVEAAAVSLVAADRATPMGAAVRPLAGLRHVWDAGEVRLLVGGDELAAWPEGDGFEDAVWSLDLRPDGHLTVRRGGALLSGGELSVSVGGPARLVVHGRNASAAPGTGAGVRAVRATVELCDIPDAWESATPVALRSLGRGELDDSGAGELLPVDGGRLAPTVARTGGGDLVVAATVDEAFRLGFLDGPELRLLDGAVHRPRAPFEAGGIGDPELFETPGAEGWALLYSATDGAGRRRIGRLDASGSSPLGPWQPREVALLAGGDDGTGAQEALDRPTVAASFDGTWAMVVRVTDGDGRSNLRAYASIDGGETFDRLRSPTLSELTGGVGVESASLVVHNGAWQLFVSRREGARSRVDLLASDDLLRWREVATDILGGEPGRGFDRFGARGLDVVAGADRLDAIYVGLDGVAATLARAERFSPTLGQR